MTVGVMKTISSVLDWLLTSERKRYFTRGMSQRTGISDRVVWVESLIRPPITSVWLSWTTTSVCASRSRMMGGEVGSLA